MSETSDFYSSWLGCAAFGAGSSLRLQAPEPIVFVPTDLSGCGIWFDAANDLSVTVDTKDNTSILTWQNLGDLSGSMVPYVGTGSYGVDTVNSLPVVLFGPSNNMYWYGELPTQEKTAFVVFNCLSDLTTIGAPYLNLWNGEATQGFQLGLSYSLPNFYYSLCRSGDWCNYGTTTDNPQNIPKLVSYRITTDLSSNFININGVPLTLQENHTADGFNVYPIPYSVNRTDGSSQDMCEIVIYNRALNDTEVAQVEAYLIAKWDVK